MTLKNTSTEYGTISKVLHWTIALLVVVLLIVGFLIDSIGDKALKMQVVSTHKMFGLTVLVLAILRVIWILNNRHPGYPITTPNWQKIAARSIHGLFYIVIIAMPLSGWIMSTAAGHPPAFFGAFPWIPVNKPLSKNLKEVHEMIGFLIIGLLTLHVGAALKHYFVDQDNILQRMLPK